MRVLIADDEQMLLEMLSEFVTHLGHETVLASNGEEAFNIIKDRDSEPVDVALMDIKMPEMSGLEILHAVRENPDSPLIILMTADPSVKGAAQAVRDGAFEYMLKPMKIDHVAYSLERAERMLILRKENLRYRERLEALVAEKTAELIAKNEELSETCDTLSLALESAKRSSRLASLGELASGVAHEIRNPLSAISLVVGNLAIETKGNEMAAECISDIQKTVEHLSHTVERILNFARPPRPSLKPGCLSEIMERSLGLSKSYLKNNRMSVEQRLDRDLPQTQLDEAQCEQILVNLIINATRAMHLGGHLTVTTWQEGNKVCAAVSDTGPGVPEEMRQKIFAPFYSGFESGTGLGLSISRSLAESHGGDLHVSEAPDNSGGAQFILVLPLVNSTIGIGRK
ncbi:MAG: response regulator [Planctomycetes bacterium]|nr:response regulator [Planctomycetota bacterium]